MAVQQFDFIRKKGRLTRNKKQSTILIEFREKIKVTADPSKKGS